MFGARFLSGYCMWNPNQPYFYQKTCGRRVVTVSEGLKILLSKNPDFRAFSSFSHANLTTLEWVLKVM